MAAAIDEKIIPGRRLGWVTNVNRGKGFAFIRGVDGEEYFAHVKTFSQQHWDALQNGDNVSFEAVDTIKGYRAARVRIATVKEGQDIHDAKEKAGNAAAAEPRSAGSAAADEDARGNRSGYPGPELGDPASNGHGYGERRKRRYE